MDILLRKRDETDSEFLFQLLGEVKIAELNAADWPEQMKNSIVSIQFNGYEQMIKSEYPDSEDFVIMFNSMKVGRLHLNKNENGLRILNISILPAFHNRGIGSKVIRDIIYEADLNNKPVYLEVDRLNPAFHLYRKLGFEIEAQDEIKYGMKYSASKT